MVGSSPTRKKQRWRHGRCRGGGAAQHREGMAGEEERGARLRRPGGGEVTFQIAAVAANDKGDIRAPWLAARRRCDFVVVRRRRVEAWVL